MSGEWLGLRGVAINDADGNPICCCACGCTKRRPPHWDRCTDCGNRAHRAPADRPTTEPRTEEDRAMSDLRSHNHTEDVFHPLSCGACAAVGAKAVIDGFARGVTADRPTTEPRPRAEKYVCQYIFRGTRNRCEVAPEHPVHIYGQWHGPEEYHAFVPAEAAQGAAPLTDWEKSELPRHTDDGNGGCVVCREWDGTFGEDDEMLTTIVSWPCAKVRLASLSERAAPRAEGLPDYPPLPECDHAADCICIEFDHTHCCGNRRVELLAAPRAEGLRDLTMAEMLDTLRWIIEKDGAIPAKGSDREQRFIDLWTRRLIIEVAAPRAEGLDVERLTEALGIVFPDIGAVPFYGQQLATEYARLSRASDERVPEEADHE